MDIDLLTHGCVDLISQAELEAVVSLALAVGGGFEEENFLHPKKYKIK